MAIQLNLLSSQQQLEEVAEVECVDGPKSPGFGECSLSFTPAHPVPPEVWRVQAGKLIVEGLKGLRRMADKSGAGGGGKALVPKGSGGNKPRTHQDNVDEIMAKGPGSRIATHEKDVGAVRPTVDQLVARAKTPEHAADSINTLEKIVAGRDPSAPYLDAAQKLIELSKLPETEVAATSALVRILKSPLTTTNLSDRLSPDQIRNTLVFWVKSHPNATQILKAAGLQP